MVLSDEDRVVVVLARKLRAVNGREYARFLRLAAKSLLVAEMRRSTPGEICVDLTERSTDELQIV